jgi:ATP-binding cassette subfamily B protein
VSTAPATRARPADDAVVSAVGDWRLLLRLARWLQPYRGLVVAQLTLLAVASGLQVAQPLLERHALDVAIPQGDARRLALVALAYVGLLVAELATRWGSTLTMMLTGQGVVRDLRKAVFARMLRLDQATFDKTPVGRLMVRATSDVESLEEMFSSGVVAGIGDLLKLVLLLVVMLSLDVRLTLVTVAIAPLFVAASWWYPQKIREAYRRVRSRLSQLNAYLQEVIQGIGVVRVFAQEPQEVRRFGERNRRLLADDLGAVGHDSAFSALVEMLGALATAAVLWWGGVSTLGGAVTFGTVYAFLRFAQQFFGPLQDLAGKVAVLQTAMASSERVFALLDEEDRIRSPQPGTVPRPPQARGAVQLCGVTFAYGEGDPVLRDVSIDVEPGCTIALVGATGSGKTTITRLLNRLHDLPRERPAGADRERVPGGAVLLDGLDVRDYPLDVLRRRVGVVLQEPFLFSGTVRDNLFLEAPADPGGATASDARAWEALAAVGAEDVVRRLGGLGGAIRERGGNLSVGERQLLTFARALLVDPTVLVLDEATASVDSQTERRLQSALATLKAKRTTVVVAHRLSTVREADEIVVLHHGRVRERGTHAKLMARDGIYRRLVRLQLRGE